MNTHDPLELRRLADLLRADILAQLRTGAALAGIRVEGVELRVHAGGDDATWMVRVPSGWLRGAGRSVSARTAAEDGAECAALALREQVTLRLAA